jgi:hypothetical protein
LTLAKKMIPGAGNPLIYVNRPARPPRIVAAAVAAVRRRAMLIQLLVGSAVSTINIMLHATVTVIAIRIARAAARRSTARPLLYLAGVMSATSLVLMAAHILEVFVWSVAYAIVNAAPDDANLVYFAFVN